MTLVELMIVVVIIGILAAIATVGYRKYIGRSRLSEATAMLAEFAAKEQLYFLDTGQYLQAHKTGVEFPSVNEDAGQFHPHDPTVTWDSARQNFPVEPLPTSWRRLGVRPRWRQLFCTYMVNAGVPNSTTWPIGAVSSQLWEAQPNVAWFYAIAACNLVGQGGWPMQANTTPVTVLALTHDSPAIRTWDE
jgi:prepilin-type N-terminal cleavage/methylation domain-containing protein